jgi:hypothetical protein
MGPFTSEKVVDESTFFNAMYNDLERNGGDY